LFEMHNKSPLH